MLDIARMYVTEVRNFGHVVESNVLGAMRSSFSSGKRFAELGSFPSLLLLTTNNIYYYIY